MCTGESVCPTPTDTCTFYTCNPASGDCTKGTRQDGDACGPTGSAESTWDKCNFECRAGRCVGKVTNCDSADQTVTDPASCTGYSCNPRTGMCEAGPKPGKPCNDGNSCTANDICKDSGGKVVCAGELNQCADQPAIPCHTWECKPLLGECVKVPQPFKTPCGGDGTDACKTDGICSGGVCLFNRKCDRLTGLDGQCAENVCDAMTGNCRKEFRPEGSACILDNGRPRGEDFCGGNYTCNAIGKCEGDLYEDKKNHSECVGAVVVDSGAGDTAALVVGLSTAGAVLVAILVAALLMMFVNKSNLTDPSTWGMGSSTGLENNPLYDESAGGTTNALYEG